MSVAVKICGLSTLESVAAAALGGAKFAGFVFYPPSPRNLSPEQAAPLAAGVPSGISRVGVFVDPEDELLERVLAKAPLDLIQLHGEESPERVEAIKRKFGKQAIKAIKISSEADLGEAGDDGERRLELVRHIGDEVTAHGLDPLELADIARDQQILVGAIRNDLQQQGQAFDAATAIDQRFVEARGFDVLLDTGRRRAPRELVLELNRRRTKVDAYWDDVAFVD